MNTSIILFSGPILSGKTTSANLTTEYFKSLGIDSICIPWQGSDNKLVDMEAELIKAIASDKHKYILLDGRYDNVFDRMKIFDIVNLGNSSKYRTIRVYGVEHYRSKTYIVEKAKDSMPFERISSMYQSYQPIIYREGFRSIIKVSGKFNVDPGKLHAHIMAIENSDSDTKAQDTSTED